MLLARLLYTTNEITATLRKRKESNDQKTIIENQVNHLRLNVRTANGAAEGERAQRAAAEQRLAAVTRQIETERANHMLCAHF